MPRFVRAALAAREGPVETSPRFMRGPLLGTTIAIALTFVGAPARAANEYQCGEGGHPDAASGRCACPSGKVESTNGKGVSRCVPAPPPGKPNAPLIRPSATCPPDSDSIDGRCQKRAICPPDSTPLGDQCIKRVECPAGTMQFGDRCVAEVICPEGFRFEAPRGCVSLAPITAPGAASAIAPDPTLTPPPPPFVSRSQGGCPAGMAWIGKSPSTAGLGARTSHERWGVAFVGLGIAIVAGASRVRKRRSTALAGTLVAMVGCAHAAEGPEVHHASPPPQAGYCLDVAEATVREFDVCVAAGKCAAPVRGGACNDGLATRSEHPVNCLDWSAAASFCAWEGKRLPTADELHWAAQNGDLATSFPWGAAEPADQACFAKGDGTCAVGSHPAGDDRWGVKDLAGNVAEWTSSRWSDDAPNRVIVGGGWHTTDALMLRADRRDSLAPEEKSSNVGVRCAKSP
jgi:hypothetical protein